MRSLRSKTYIQLFVTFSWTLGTIGWKYIFKEFLQWHVKKTLTFPQRENVFSKFKKSFTHIFKPKIGTAQSILRYETIVFGKIPIFPLEYNSAIKNRAYRYLWGSLYFLRDRNVISTSPLSKKIYKTKFTVLHILLVIRLIGKVTIKHNISKC